MQNRLIIIYLLCCSSVGIAGCDGVSIVLDGGTNDAGSPDGMILEITNPTPRSLTFGEEATFEARLLQNGIPAGGETIVFALEGQAQDSTLTEVSVGTDSDGRAQSRLTAGQMPAAFRVRISVAGLRPAYVDVAVNNIGFGALRVRARYEGERSGAIQRRVLLYAERNCEAALPLVADRVGILRDPMIDNAEFSPIPAGLQYAVVGQVVGNDETLLASGCTLSSIIEPNEIADVEIVFTDSELKLEGSYNLSLTADFENEAQEAGAEISATGNGYLVGMMQPEYLFLNALERELERLGETSTAADLRTRAVSAAADLEMRLSAAATGPTELIAHLRDVVSARFRNMELRGLLTLGAGRYLNAVWSVEQLRAFGTSSSEALALDMSETDIATTDILFERTESDRVDIRQLELAFPYGTTLMRLLNQEAFRERFGSLTEYSRSYAGCAEFEAWVMADTMLAPRCDVACAALACTNAVSELILAIESGLLRLDNDYASIATVTTLGAIDENGDLDVDRLRNESIEVIWQNAMGSDGRMTNAEISAQRNTMDAGAGDEG